MVVELVLVVVWGVGLCDDINLKGTDRPLLCKPQGFTWRFLDETVDVDGGESVDIELTLTLPPGRLATMLVR